jgi:hypothetical protein
MKTFMKILGFIFLVVLILLIIASIKMLDILFTALMSVFAAVYVAWIVILIFFD